MVVPGDGHQGGHECGLADGGVSLYKRAGWTVSGRMEWSMGRPGPEPANLNTASVALEYRLSEHFVRLLGSDDVLLIKALKAGNHKDFCSLFPKL